MKSKIRLLVLSVPAGSGHIKAAEALCQVAKDNFGMKVDHVDFLGYLNPAFSKLLGKGWYLMVKYTPLMCKLIYENTDKPNQSFKKIGNVLKINIRKYKKLLDEYKPDLILSTHPLPAAVASWMYDRLPIPNGVVITDYVSHSMWAYPKNNRIFVARKTMIRELKRNGLDENKICVSGIPVRPVFLETFKKELMKRKLGLDEEKPSLLVMSGGDATGPFVEILKSLAKVKGDFQVVVIAGKNEEMRKSLMEKFEFFGLRGKVLGFVKEIEDYMRSADLLISKAGGLTTTEAMAIGLPMLVVRPTPGQEDGNTKFLVRGGAGIHIKDIRKIGMVVEKLLNNPKRIDEMKKKAKILSQPKAGEEIIKEMMKLL